MTRRKSMLRTHDPLAFIFACLFRTTGVLCVAGALLLAGCAGDGGAKMFGREKVVGRDILQDDITEFVYTYENINYGAEYQRYRFYREDGRYLFFHEHRERPDAYGPATEEDITASGNFELTEEQWTEFFGYLSEGKVIKRRESVETGGSGPWTYLYWKNDGSKYQEFSFASYDAQTSFENFCKILSEE